MHCSVSEALCLKLYLASDMLSGSAVLRLSSKCHVYAHNLLVNVLIFMKLNRTFLGKDQTLIHDIFLLFSFFLQVRIPYDDNDVHDRHVLPAGYPHRTWMEHVIHNHCTEPKTVCVCVCVCVCVAD